MNFENVLASGFVVTGNAFLQELLTPNPDLNFSIDQSQTSAIQVEQDAQVLFVWNQTGPLTPWLTAIWRFDVFLEQMGPNEGPLVLPGQKIYDSTLNSDFFACPIPAGSVPVGLYRVTARMMLLGSGSLLNDTTASPVVSFEDLGLVQFHNA
jgi:hypothetical protein